MQLICCVLFNNRESKLPEKILGFVLRYSGGLFFVKEENTLVLA
jgi:hypothetical protein